MTLNDSPRCPHCGATLSPLRLAVQKMYTGRPPSSYAEAAKSLGVSRQRVHQIVKKLGLTPSGSKRTRKRLKTPSL